MAYIFYLGEVQLPIAPSKLQLKINSNNKTANLINEGEINIIKTPGLTDISFEILLPNVKYPFATYPNGFKSADYYLEVLEKLKLSTEPFQFIVTRIKPNGDYLFDTNIKVTLEDYTIIEDAEKYGMDICVSISLKQYRAYCTKVLSIKDKNTTNTLSSTRNINISGTGIAGSGTTGTSTPYNSKMATVEKNRASNKRTSGSYTIKSGDTLWSICQKQLGDGSKYAEIAKLNAISNPNLIKVGQVIKLG